MWLFDLFDDLIDAVLGNAHDITELGVDPDRVPGTADKAAHYRELAAINPVAAQTAQMIDGITSSTPNQLHGFTRSLEASNLSDDITQSVRESEADLRASDATHQLRIDADAAEIDADSVLSSSESLIRSANSELGKAY